jgi:hypothetical protein
VTETELVGRVIALSAPALATGGMLAQIELFHSVPVVQLEVTFSASKISTPFFKLKIV